MSTVPTAARTTEQGSSHYYTADGQPAYEVPRADGKGMRRTTIADCRKLNLLPSCTTILRLLDKPALNKWKEEMSCLAVLTTPRKEGEALDAFVWRVLNEDREQEQESQLARDKGIEIHAALEMHFTGREVPANMEAYVRPVIDALIARGSLASAEMVLLGEGYAGKCDLVQDCEQSWAMSDFKTCKKLPDPNKSPYTEHLLQLAAYAKAFQDKLKRAGQNTKPIIVSNVYISTTTPGEYVIIEHDQPWEETFEKGFLPLLRYFFWANSYWPVAPTPAPVVAPPFPEAAYKAHIAELEKRLADQAAQVAPPAEAAPVATAAVPALPTHKDGKRIQWSTGVQSPATRTQTK